MRIAPKIEPIEKTSVPALIAARRTSRPRRRGRSIGRVAHSQLNRRLKHMYDSLKNLAVPPHIEDLVFGGPAGVRDGPTEVYGDRPMKPLELFQHLREVCRREFGLPPVLRHSYVSVSEAYAITRCCYYEFNANYDQESGDVRWYRLSRCLTDLMLYHLGRDSLPDYLKSAVLNGVTFSGTPAKLRTFYALVVELSSQQLARFGEQPQGSNPAFHTLGHA